MLYQLCSQLGFLDVGDSSGESDDGERSKAGNTDDERRLFESLLASSTPSGEAASCARDAQVPEDFSME